MKNIRNILGIIVLSAVIGFLMVSCNSDPEPKNSKSNSEYTWKFNNQSSYEVNVFNTNFSPSEFTLAAGASRSFTNSNNSVSFLYTPADIVDASANATSSGGTFTFRDR